MKKSTVITLVVLVAVIVLAGAGYKFLGQKYMNQTNTTASRTQEETSLKQAEDFTVFDRDGNEVRLSSLQGKPTVVNFWATWCYYCMSEMPDFQEVYDQYKDKVNFAMVNLTDGSRETKENAQNYVAQHNFTFPVYYDLNREAYQKYSARSIPMTYFITANGEVYHFNMGKMEKEQLINILQDMLSLSGKS